MNRCAQRGCIHIRRVELKGPRPGGRSRPRAVICGSLINLATSEFKVCVHRARNVMGGPRRSVLWIACPRHLPRQGPRAPEAHRASATSSRVAKTRDAPDEEAQFRRNASAARTRSESPRAGGRAASVPDRHRQTRHKLCSPPPPFGANPSRCRSDKQVRPQALAGASTSPRSDDHDVSLQTHEHPRGERFNLRGPTPGRQGGDPVRGSSRRGVNLQQFDGGPEAGTRPLREGNSA